MPQTQKNILLMLALVTGAWLTVMAQPEGGYQLQERFNNWRNRYLQEKLFVHTDREDYLAGEICWFKIWCVDGSLHHPLSVSKVAYVEILNGDNHPVLQAKIDLEKAEGEGSFFLPVTLNPGNYKLRAYTNWMKNTGPDFFFEKPITIFNTIRTPTAAPISFSAPAPSAASITLFPEGGDILKDVASTIAFRIAGADGKGSDCRGVVIDEKQDTVAFFHPLRFGIGRFSFHPAGGHTYKALAQLPDGTTIARDLPTPVDQGYNLSLIDGGNGFVSVTVHARQPSGRMIYLFGQTRQMPAVNASAALTGDSALFMINKDSLGMGITQLTVFDATLKPVCERLYFKRPSHRLLIDVKGDAAVYGMRKKVNLALLTGAEAGKMLPASLSLSVYRLDSLLPDRVPATFYDYLWLSSDLKGRIESPEYYFSASGPEADQALDNLMLTHGWRRWRWETVLNDRHSGFSWHPEINGQLITGKLTDPRNGQPVRDRSCFLSVPGTAYHFFNTKTDSAGRFVFDVRDFYGPDGFIIQTGTTQDSSGRVDIANPFSEQYSTSTLPAFALPETWQHADPRSPILRRSIAMQAQNVYSQDSLRQFITPMLDTLHFFGRPDYSYKLDEFTRFTTMEEVLREYVREINVGRLHGQKHLLMLNEPRHEFFHEESTLVLLDGIPISDDRIFSYDPLKIKKLEVVPKLFYMGSAVFGGIASFTTYQGNYEGLELDSRSIQVDYEGLQWKREFYSPEYTTPQQAESWLPDLRDLLFWSGDIHTDGQTKKMVEFYTSDLPGKYLVTVQGLSVDGQAGTGSFMFEVAPQTPH
jgi:hypothetical protein